MAGDGLLRHQDRRGVDRLGELRGHEHSGKKDRLRVGEAGAKRDGSGVLVDKHLAEFDGAGVAVVSEPSGELQPHLRRGRDNTAAAKRAGTQRKEVRRQFLDVDEHRVELE